jgi:hypothetical protein
MNPLNALREKEEIRNEDIRDEERLTTADIANTPRPGSAPRAADANLDAGNIRLAAPGQAVQHNPLFPQDELQNFRSRWDQVQTSFVDEPRAAVEQADSLVANVVKRIAEQFASEREQLEKQWDRGENVNTEELRQALKRYRAFFDRLLVL